MLNIDGRYFLITAGALLICISTIPSFGQVDSKQGLQGKTESEKVNRTARPNDDDFLQKWKLELDEAASESVMIPNEYNRPKAIGDVANSYWLIDVSFASELFVKAIRLTLDLKPVTKEEKVQFEEAIRYLLVTAATRSTSLSKRMNELVIEKQKKSARESNSVITAAIDLLNSDARRAAELAADCAPAGLASDAAGVFILQLAKKDRGAADRVYKRYLSSALSIPEMPLGQLLWLAGYPFGYGESYGFISKDATQMTGFGGQDIAGLSANPELAAGFLAAAFKSVQATLQQAAMAEGMDKDVLNSLALFSVTYLLPEVRKFAPNTLPLWQQLYSSAVNNTTSVRQEAVERQIDIIKSNRDVAKRRASSENTASAEEKVQSSLEGAKQLPPGCERDRLYAQAVLDISFTRDFDRSIDVSGQIRNTDMRDSVRQFIYFDSAISSLAAGNFLKAYRDAESVTSLEQRAHLYAKLTGLAIAAKNQDKARELLWETRRLVDRVSDAKIKVSILLTCAANWARFDINQASVMLKEAIMEINNSSSQEVENFSILRKVNLSCPSDRNARWYGSSSKLERQNLFDTLSLLASLQPEAVIDIARGINDPAVRVRAIAVIARAQLSLRKAQHSKLSEVKN